MRNKILILVHLLLSMKQSTLPSRRQELRYPALAHRPMLLTFRHLSSDIRPLLTKGQLVKADASLCLVSVASSLCVLSYYSMSHITDKGSVSCDFLLLYCVWWKLPCKWAYWGMATFSTAKELSLFPNNWCSACASSFHCYPTMSSWVLAHSPHH